MHLCAPSAPARQHGFEHLNLGVEELGVAVDEEGAGADPRTLLQPAHRTSGVACQRVRIMHQMEVR
jgi:hypothetical protein